MSRDDTRRTLICYDIINDRRRTRIADALSEFGDRVQYSVFVVDISPARLLQVKSRLNTIIDPGEDSILFCDLGRVAELNETKFGYLGKSREVTDNDALILWQNRRHSFERAGVTQNPVCTRSVNRLISIVNSIVDDFYSATSCRIVVTLAKR